jgi:hypothetical protein
MLTFLQSITIDNPSVVSQDDFREDKVDDSVKIYNHIKKKVEEPPVLYHLPPSMSDYIVVLSRQLRSIVARDLSEILHTKVYSDFMTVQYEVDRFCREEIELYEYEE